MTDDLELFREYRRTRAAELRDQLVERHLGLVKHTASYMIGRLPRYVRPEDLYSAGALGLLDAVEHYDPDRGVPFPAYAGPRVRGAILDDLRRLDCVPRRTRRKLRDAQRTIEVLAQQLDREPTDAEVAARLGIDVAEYRRILGERVMLVSLDGVGADLETWSLTREELADRSTPSPLSTLEEGEQQRFVGRLMEGLPERERRVLVTYYYQDLSMQDIGEVLGVSESRVSQIHSSAVLRLRAVAHRTPARAIERAAAAATRRAHMGSVRGSHPRRSAGHAGSAASRLGGARRHSAQMTACRRTTLESAATA
jgi:RNA polymerase sigma factor for flagellar operon FliA